MASVSDRTVGALLLILAAVIFGYYTTWTLALVTYLAFVHADVITVMLMTGLTLVLFLLCIAICAAAIFSTFLLPTASVCYCHSSVGRTIRRTHHRRFPRLLLFVRAREEEGGVIIK